MNSVPAPADGLRRAALALHALAAEDRRWIIEQLGATERQAVLPLLDELHTLGIPADPALVRTALGPAEAKLAASMSDSTLEEEAARLRVALDREPLPLQGFWLAALAPAMRDAVLGHGRAMPEAPPNELGSAPKLREAITIAWRHCAGSGDA